MSSVVAHPGQMNGADFARHLGATHGSVKRWLHEGIGVHVVRRPGHGAAAERGVRVVWGE